MVKQFLKHRVMPALTSIAMVFSVVTISNVGISAENLKNPRIFEFSHEGLTFAANDYYGEINFGKTYSVDKSFVENDSITAGYLEKLGITDKPTNIPDTWSLYITDSGKATTKTINTYDDPSSMDLFNFEVNGNDLVAKRNHSGAGDFMNDKRECVNEVSGIFYELAIGNYMGIYDGSHIYFTRHMGIVISTEDAQAYLTTGVLKGFEGTTIKGLKEILESNGFTAKPATILKLNWKTLTLGLGEKYQLEATTNSTDNIKWSSSDKTVATVNSSGRITAKETGTTVITATIDGVKRTCTLTVKNAPEKVSVKSKNITISVKQRHQIKVTLPSGTASKSRTFESSNSEIANVNNTGIITGVKTGTCTITVTTFNGKSVTINVVVDENESDLGVFTS